MNCSHCGAPNPEESGVAFCGSCGARLSSRISSDGPGVSQVPRGLRAMAVGDLLDETIRLYRQNFRTFVGISALLVAPLTLFFFIQAALAGPATTDMTSFARSAQTGTPVQLGAAVYFAMSMFVAVMLYLLFFIVSQAAVTSAISERYMGREATIGGAYRVARGGFWRILWTSLRVIIVLYLLFLTVVGIPFAVSRSIRWSMVVPVIVLEGKGVRQSLKRSSSLVKGSWWRVLGILILAYIVTWLVATVPSSVISYGVDAVVMLIAPNSLPVATTFGTLVGSIFGIVSAPLLPAICTLLYYDLRIRKEGYDLELLAGQTSPA